LSVSLFSDKHFPVLGNFFTSCYRANQLLLIM